MKVKVPMKSFLLIGHTIGFRLHMNDKLERFRVTFTANDKREIHVEKFSKEMSS